MAAKQKTIYSCQSCGHHSHKWLGRCPSCGEWSTFVEEMEAGAISLTTPAFIPGAAGPKGIQPLVPAGSAVDSNGGVTSSDAPLEKSHRYSTQMGELDRLLGGGIVRDSFVLVGGDPGVGKSTLLLHVVAGLIEKQPDLKILYLSGEESVEQIQARAKRLSVPSTAQVGLVSETRLESALQYIQEYKPNVVMVDSLQTFRVDYLESSPGSVGQLREITNKLMQLAKQSQVNVWLVGHVTKDGQIAGPKVVEHMVDTVLYFEGDHTNDLRILRTVKNRFGSVREIAVFEMDGIGLRQIENPSEYFFTQRAQAVAGTTVVPILEGSRTLLIELQALVCPTSLANPRRMGSGVEHHRLSLWVAVLEKYLHLPLGQCDIFFNVAGGLRISEPGADLSGIVAIFSSAKDIAFPSDWIWIAEIGLTGEVRRVSQTLSRLKEAEKLGFKKAFISSAEDIRRLKREITKLEMVTISHISEIRNLMPTSSLAPKSSRRIEKTTSPVESSAGRSMTAPSDLGAQSLS